MKVSEEAFINHQSIIGIKTPALEIAFCCTAVIGDRKQDDVIFYSLSPEALDEWRDSSFDPSSDHRRDDKMYAVSDM